MWNFVFLLICCVTLREDLTAVLATITEQLFPSTSHVAIEDPFNQSDTPAACEDDLNQSDDDLGHALLLPSEQAPEGTVLVRTCSCQELWAHPRAQGCRFALKKLLI